MIIELTGPASATGAGPVAGMRKIAIIFIAAVIGPSLMLGWLALRSLKDQQFVLERQQVLHCSSQTTLLAAGAQSQLDNLQTEFSDRVNALIAGRSIEQLAPDFDGSIRSVWPVAEVGFVVSLKGRVLSPPLTGPLRCLDFRMANDKFLCSSESVEVYWNSPKGTLNLSRLNHDQAAATNEPEAAQGAELWLQLKNSQVKGTERNVVPASLGGTGQVSAQSANSSQSDLVSSEADFRQMVGDAQEGMFARFLQNKLHVMLWYRSRQNPELVFGAQLNLKQVRNRLIPVIVPELPTGGPDEDLDNVAIALLDDEARPVAVRPAGFIGDWKRPFAANEIGEALPHWEIAAYLLDPQQHKKAARITRWSLGSLTVLLLAAVAIGGWLIVADVRRQLALARQKTDFVSSVSHELKTPLTSIRMFAELLAAKDSLPVEKRRSYVTIINNESSRLSRLINNVLDFARMDRDKQVLSLTTIDLAAVTREVWETQLPQFAGAGFSTSLEIPDQPVWIRGNRDGIAQIIVNLLSNAGKFSTGRKEIRLELKASEADPNQMELRVLDRGCGVPAGARTRIFEQFYRANDSLASGAGGVGLGLTLARQIARLHGGELYYRPREGGGSEFVFVCPKFTIPTSIT